MNNSQFRRLVHDTPTTARGTDGGATGGPSGSRTSATPSALGSRMRSSIPMTPRSVASGGGIDFARQLAERDASLNATTKMFRSSAAPKGTKLGSGYQDRTQHRTSVEEDDKASRIKALEEMVKLGQMERATFEALRDEIVGGNVKDVHLVKGLDWKLLERARRGEDVLAAAVPLPNTTPAPLAEGPPADESVNVDEEFDKLEERNVQQVTKQESVKKGEMAPPPLPTAGRKRTRDDILKELKASRQAAAEKAEQARQPALGSKFHKIGNKMASSRIEIDARGREVLITVDADGNVKRKVKKAKLGVDPETNGLLMPDKDAKPLGLDVMVPETPAIPEEQDDGDIFEGVGGDYDPLGEQLSDQDSSDESQDGVDGRPGTKKSPSQSPLSEKDTIPLPNPPSTPRNYFGEPTPTSSDSTSPTAVPFRDPTILAALKKASTLDPLSSSEDPSASEEASKAAHRRKLLESHDRDADDLDMGFGSSRFEDEEEGEGKKVKLSVWGSGAGDDDGEGGGKGKDKRKRGPKKRKGDKNSAADVLKVLEGRKGRGR